MKHQKKYQIAISEKQSKTDFFKTYSVLRVSLTEQDAIYWSQRLRELMPTSIVTITSL